jgi:ubiquinone/menaquinone biosynthesis C-methylase UbiE
MRSQDIRLAYEGKSPNEWARLESSPYARIEHIITTHSLQCYLPPQGFILDAGSGPGRYAIDLVKQGYQVVMFDLVHEMLTLGREKSQKQAFPKKK